MNRKRLVLSIAMCFVIVLAIFFYYTQIRQQPKISNTLSARSQAFIKKQQSGQSGLQFVNLTGPVGDDTRNKRIGREQCYSFVIPYRVTISRYEDTSGNICSARFSFDTPKGAIISYIYKKPVSSWEDVAGVSSRRGKPDEYEEQQKTINGKSFLLFRRKDVLYEKNVFYYTPNFFFVFNLITSTNEDLDADVEQMLETLEFEL